MCAAVAAILNRLALQRAHEPSNAKPGCQDKVENSYNFEILASILKMRQQAEGNQRAMGLRIETPEIYSDLQRRLMTAGFGSGQKLKPKELQGIYGCSANTIRDVLLRLSKVGLVEFEIQRGFRTKPVTPERRRDVTEFRILLEQEGARRCMERGGVVWEAELTAAHHKLSHIEREIERTGDVIPNVDAWSEAELEFHLMLVSSSGSEVLRESYLDTYAQFRQQAVGLAFDFSSGYFDAIISEHLAIVEAALARDLDACQQAIYDHMKRNL